MRWAELALCAAATRPVARARLPQLAASGATLAPGSLLVAAPGSFDHYFYEAVVLIVDHSEEGGSRGVLLNHETPWWIEDLNADLKAFRSNTVFLGGERGNDAMTMLHAHPTLDGARQITDGLCTGGLAAATKAVEAGTLPAADFKFFFKGSEWLPGQLAKEVEDSLWDILNYDGSLALRQTGHRSLWRVARARKLRTARKAGAKATPPATTTTLGGAQAPSPPSPTEGRRRRPPDPFPAYTGSDADRPTVPVEVLGFRRFMGNAQWRVRWADGDESWEVWGALADALPQNPDEAASESAARKFADDTWREHGR